MFDCIMGIAFKLNILLYFKHYSNFLTVFSVIAFSYFGLRILGNLIYKAKKKDISELETQFKDNLQIL